ncbi:Cj0814 family flagellar-dependent secreted protein [Helicobacter burdigaliensis]|uniref:Cj0814 family flagellar-dependent secreted protein n=1 Tax=Helicobacter burdigaliensis TaxID=2315334 RepID=UPI000EF6A4F8|nr:hypothetical protein [Helicobacter burdigaliensis]
MISSINSYSNYNYANTFSHTANTKSSNIINETLNLVSNKSQAVNKVLGYGVDKDGFFTSDFNEAAGLPQDYKIYAKGLEEMRELYTNMDFLTMYVDIDIAKSIGNAYEAFSKIVKDKDFGANFTQEDLQSLEEYRMDFWKGLQSGEIFVLDMGSLNRADFGAKVYEIKEGEISKGGALMAFLRGAGFKIIEGRTTILGKMAGVDKDISKEELKELQEFMNANRTQSSFAKNPFGEVHDWSSIETFLSMQLFVKRAYHVDTQLGKQAENFSKEFQELTNKLDLSLDEFKRKYLDFKQRHDKFVEELKEAERAVGLDYDKYPTGKPVDDTEAIKEAQEKKEKKKKEAFKPIQGESENKETYKDDNKRNELLRELLKTKFGKSEELEILFGVEFSNDTLEEFNKFQTLNSTKSIEIKA